MPERPRDPRRALPRRAGRLAPGGALAVRVEGQRAVGARDRRAPAGAARRGVPRLRGRRRHRPAAARCAGRRRAEVVPTAEDVLLDPAEVEQVVVAELGGSSLYASRFRECAARALLLPRRDPRRRTPLWQQRQRASQLLTVAGRYEQFPVTLEAMRECVQDVYDLPGLRDADGRRAGPRGAGRRGGHPLAVAVRAQPAVRLRGDVPLRGRRTAGRTSRRGALAGLHAAGRVAGVRGDPRAARSGGAGRGRGVAAAARPRAARPRRRGRRRPAPLRRRPHHRRGGRPRRPRGVARRAGARAAGHPRAHRRRGALPADRGRGPGARRVGRRPAGRRARDVHRAGGRSAR